jgi:hypothetical protein
MLFLQRLERLVERRGVYSRLVGLPFAFSWATVGQCPALVYLLNEQKLTLLDPQFWDDANDSHYLNLSGKRSASARCSRSVSQTVERYPYWRVFASGSGGVCISFKRPAGLAERAGQVPKAI